MIRNATTFEKFVPLSTNGNEVMVYANCASAYNGPFVGYWDFQCQERVREAQGDPPGDESQTALYWRSLGFNYARDHIGELPRVVTLRVLRQWELFRPLQNVNLGGIEGRNRDASTMGLLMFYGLAGLSIVGAVSMRRRRIPAAAARRAVPQRHDHRRRTRTAACGSAPRPSRRCACSARSAWCPSSPSLAVGWHAEPRRRGCDRRARRCSVRARWLGWACDRDWPGRGSAARLATWAAIGSVLRADRAAAARSVPHHRRNDGRSVHDGVPGADDEGRPAQPRLPPPLRPGRAAGAGGLGTRSSASRWNPSAPSGSSSTSAIIFALFALARPWGRIAAACCRRAGRVLRADADRADGDGVERRAGAVPVEHRLRPPRPLASPTRVDR